MRTGDLRLAAPATATARELAKTAAREVPAAPADRRTQHRGARLRKRDGKFSCLQRIEKAQNVEIFSATEDGVGATDRERGGSFARRSICMRERHRHRRAQCPEQRHVKIILPVTH
jgi:hypothetical protein